MEKISGIPTNYNSVEIHNLDLKQLIKKGLAPSVTDLDLWKDQLQLMHLLARVNLYMMWCTVKMMQRVIQKIKSSKEIHIVFYFNKINCEISQRENKFKWEMLRFRNTDCSTKTLRILLLLSNYFVYGVFSLLNLKFEW